MSDLATRIAPPYDPDAEARVAQMKLRTKMMEREIRNATRRSATYKAGKQDCLVCKRHKAISELHHLWEVHDMASAISCGLMQFSDIELILVWLCPTHHSLWHLRTEIAAQETRWGYGYLQHPRTFLQHVTPEEDAAFCWLSDRLWEFRYSEQYRAQCEMFLELTQGLPDVVITAKGVRVYVEVPPYDQKGGEAVDQAASRVRECYGAFQEDVLIYGSPPDYKW